jgi:hypothetical protein
MTTADTFITGGGFDHADAIADGAEKRCQETIRQSGRAASPVVLSTVDVLWLVDAYNRLRRRHEAIPYPSGAAAEVRKRMLRNLTLTVEACQCEWPLQKYRNGDGHRADCPAHYPLGALEVLRPDGHTGTWTR